MGWVDEVRGDASAGGSAVEFSPATRVTRVRLPAGAASLPLFLLHHLSLARCYPVGSLALRQHASTFPLRVPRSMTAVVACYVALGVGGANFSGR